MQYALLIYTNEAAYATMTQEEFANVLQTYRDFTLDMQERGIMKGGEQLQPASTATTVRIRNAKALITDGPFAETKEQLGGFFLLECKDLDEAIGLASRLPDAQTGSIEIRPIVDNGM